MEHTPQQSSDGMVVVRVLAAVLDRLVNSNAHLVTSNSAGPVTKFHALKTPGISVLQYLERIQKYACCSTECFILALIYIDRLIQQNNFILTELNAHRVVITAILLAAKFFDDAYYNNAYYAKVGGVLISEMNGLEVEFLFRINFSLHVKPDVFMKYQAELVSHALGAGLEEPTITTDLSKLEYPQPTESTCTNSGTSSLPPSPQPTTSNSSESSNASMTYQNDPVSSNIVHPISSVQKPTETHQQQHNQQQYIQSTGPQSMITDVVPQESMPTTHTESCIDPNMFNRHITPSPSPNGGGHIAHNYYAGQEIQEQHVALNDTLHQQQQQGHNQVVHTPDETVYYNHQSTIDSQQVEQKQADPIPIIQRFNSYPLENQLNSSNITSCEQPIKSCSHVEYLNSTTSPYEQSHQAIQLNHTIYLKPNTNEPYQQQQYQHNLINNTNNMASPVEAPTRKMGLVSSACSQFGRRQVFPTPNASSPQYIEATASHGAGGGVFYRSS